MSLPKIIVGRVPPGAVAWVPVPDLIVVRERKFASHRRLIAHELQHVIQHNVYGWMFYVHYVWGWVTAGFSYRRNWMERDARLAETDPEMLEWADQLIERFNSSSV